MQTYSAVLRHDGPWWIGWVEEVPGVNCQEPTREELLDSLRVTLREAIEMNREDAREAAGTASEPEFGLSHDHLSAFQGGQVLDFFR